MKLNLDWAIGLKRVACWLYFGTIKDYCMHRRPAQRAEGWKVILQHGAAMHVESLIVFIKCKTNQALIPTALTSSNANTWSMTGLIFPSLYNWNKCFIASWSNSWLLINSLSTNPHTDLFSFISWTGLNVAPWNHYWNKPTLSDIHVSLNGTNLRSQ